MLDINKHLKLYFDENRLIHFIIWIGILLPSLIKAGTPRLPKLFIQSMAMTLLFLTLLFFLRKDKKIRSYYIHSMDILIIFFIILTAVSTLIANYKHNAQSCFILILSFSIFYFHISGYFSIKDMEKLWWALTGLGVLESIIGFYQVIFLNQSRITGTFYNPNHLAVFLTCLSVFLFARLVFNPSFRKNFVFKILIVLFMVSALFLTGSRGVLLALISISVAFIFLIDVKKKAFFFIIVVLILLAIIPNPLIGRLKNIHATDVYAYSRFSMWKSALSMLRDHPVFGVGIGNFGYSSYRYAFPVEKAWARYARVARYAHNELLHLGAELGIPGILFFLISVFIVFKQGLKTRINSESVDNNSGTYAKYGDESALLITIAALLSYSMVDFIFHIPALVFMLLILIAWIKIIGIENYKNNQFSFHLSEKISRLIPLICLIIPIIIIWIPIREYLGYVSFSKAYGNDIRSDIEYIEKAVSIDFGCAPYHNSLGGAYFKLYGITRDISFLAQGLREAQTAQRLNPDDHRFPLSLGFGYMNLYLIFPSNTNILEKADKEFRKSLVLAPYLYEGFLGLGRVLFYQNRLKDALNALERAVQLEPYSMSSHYWLGLTFDALGDIKSSRSEFEKILAIKRLDLGERAYIPYEKELIDFDVSKLYPILKAYDSGLK